MNLVKAMFFGITIALAIGPIALLIVNNGLRHGALAGIRSAFGASLADSGYGVAALLVGQQIVGFLAEHQALFALSSSAVLTGFGLWMVRSAWRAHGQVQEVRARGTGVLGTFALTIVNPLTIVSFLGFTGQLALHDGFPEALVLGLAIGCGTFLVGASLALFAARLNRWLHKPAILLGINMASGLGIAAFGVYGLYPPLVGFLSGK